MRAVLVVLSLASDTLDSLAQERRTIEKYVPAEHQAGPLAAIDAKLQALGAPLALAAEGADAEACARTVDNQELYRCFKRIDSNGNGYVNVSELAAFFEQANPSWEHLDKLIERFDADHDGRLTHSEVEKVVSTFDANHDGKLSESEFQRALMFQVNHPLWPLLFIACMAMVAVAVWSQGVQRRARRSSLSVHCSPLLRNAEKDLPQPVLA